MTITIRKDNPTAEMEHKGTLVMDGSTYHGSAEGTFDIAKYTNGKTLKWKTTNDIKVVLKTGTMKISVNPPTDHIKNVVEGLCDIIEDSGLDITMEDIGFTAYS
jgi:hypothetical protein